MFDTHKLNDNGFKEMQEFKTRMAKAAVDSIKQMPDSREKAIFVTKLEEAVFFGAKAIASQTKNHIEVIPY